MTYINTKAEKVMDSIDYYKSQINEEGDEMNLTFGDDTTLKISLRNYGASLEVVRPGGTVVERYLVKESFKEKYNDE